MLAKVCFAWKLIFVFISKSTYQLKLDSINNACLILDDRHFRLLTSKQKQSMWSVSLIRFDKAVYKTV